MLNAHCGHKCVTFNKKFDLGNDHLNINFFSD